MKMKLSYTRAVVIVHGKSEYIIAKHIKSNLRLKMEIVSENNGNNSIQIDGLKKVLGNTVFKNRNSFIKKYDEIEYEGKGKKFKLHNFKVFIIMDTDDCNDEIKGKYISGELFKDHWLKDYIVPVYNSENLEDILKKCDIKYKSNPISKIPAKELKSKYIEIFPIGNGDKNDEDQLRQLSKSLTRIEGTNMEEFIDYFLDIFDSENL